MKTLISKIKDRIQFIGRNVRKSDKILSQIQQARLAQLRQKGYVIIENGIEQSRLKVLQSVFKNQVEVEYQFETPCLAQNKIVESRHRPLIENYFKYSPSQMKEFGITFDRSDVKNYEQVLKEFAPSNLKVFLPKDPNFIQTWLDDQILELIEQYMGVIPFLAEAYLRRNFPAKYRVMNHFWHRDRNHPDHLLKAFFFLTDCEIENGPHEYIAGSVVDRRLDGKPYFSDEEVDAIYPEDGGQRIQSVVKAGTIILEDTRGLHRASLPTKGFRDLGFAVFVPRALYSKWESEYYNILEDTLDHLSERQRKYIPKSFIRRN
ncbi:phytanoyl-CoA dioxygenase family protein [Leptospira alstonii]|uniref:phytanoyl-CoA dioxygenase family protein n=1 Tax=Leptospira alstonii TaxID=28452 RepID=UPI000772EBBB|nr:phytanoyl-CoA dioxygenase family protein [Leptospira alstonii]